MITHIRGLIAPVITTHEPPSGVLALVVVIRAEDLGLRFRVLRRF